MKLFAGVGDFFNYAAITAIFEPVKFFVSLAKLRKLLLKYSAGAAHCIAEVINYLCFHIHECFIVSLLPAVNSIAAVSNTAPPGIVQAFRIAPSLFVKSSALISILSPQDEMRL